MKYYKGTRRRKKSSNSKLSSPESQNHSNSVEENEVSRESTATRKSQSSSSTKKEKALGKKRPSSSSPLTEKQRTGRTKRTKTNHKTPEEESNKDTQTNTEKHPDLSYDDEPKMSSNKKNKSQSTTVRSRVRGTRRNESSRTKVKSSDGIKSNSSSIADADTRKEALRNVYGTERKNSKSSKKTKSKSPEPNSQISDSSETAVSGFEDDEEEIPQVVRSGQAEAEKNSEILSVDDINRDEVISCSAFLQQQVRILKSEFEIDDCPELAQLIQGTKRQQKNHIPKEIVLKVLRKLNFKVEDELLKSLNRQAQRKILKQVDDIRSSYGMTGKNRSNEEDNTGQVEGKVKELRKTVETSTAELEGLQRLTDMAAQIGSMAEGFNTNPLVEEVKRTNLLIQKLNQKIKKGSFTNENQETLTPEGELSHQEIVDKLFS